MHETDAPLDVAVGPILARPVAIDTRGRRRAFHEMTTSPEYQAIGHLRTEALVKGELHPLDQADVP